MRKVWVVVANSSLAKFYSAENPHLVEKKVLEHYESHLHPHDLYSDRSGETNPKMGSHRKPYTPPTSPKVKERVYFADQIVDFLEENLKAGEFDRLYIIASSAFLGNLREAFSKSLAKTIAGEIDKDLTLMKPEEIRNHLPLVL